MSTVFLWVTVEGHGTFTIIGGRWKKFLGGDVEEGSELENLLDFELRIHIGDKANIFQPLKRQGEDKHDSL